MCFGRKIRVMTRAVQDQLAKVSGQVQESIGAIATVQAFVRERHEAERYRDGVEGAFQQDARAGALAVVVLRDRDDRRLRRRRGRRVARRARARSTAS